MLPLFLLLTFVQASQKRACNVEKCFPLSQQQVCIFEQSAHNLKLYVQNSESTQKELKFELAVTNDYCVVNGCVKLDKLWVICQNAATGILFFLTANYPPQIQQKHVIFARWDAITNRNLATFDGSEIAIYEIKQKDKIQLEMRQKINFNMEIDDLLIAGGNIYVLIAKNVYLLDTNSSLTYAWTETQNSINQLPLKEGTYLLPLLITALLIFALIICFVGLRA
jgi:hypothetical protein